MIPSTPVVIYSIPLTLQPQKLDLNMTSFEFWEFKLVKEIASRVEVLFIGNKEAAQIIWCQFIL